MSEGSQKKSPISVISVSLSSKFDESEGVLERKRESQYPFVTSSFLIPENTDDESISHMVDSSVSSLLGMFCRSNEMSVTPGPSVRTNQLIPLRATGDGNCLLHAISLFLWGCEDSQHTLRSLLLLLLSSSDKSALFRQMWEDEELRSDSNLLHVNEPVGASTPKSFSDKSTKSDSGESVRSPEQLESAYNSMLCEAETVGCSLGSLHIACLAHILQRPIIVYADEYLKSKTGDNLALQHMCGVYCPVLGPGVTQHTHTACSPDQDHQTPILLAYTMPFCGASGHFTPMLCRDEACDKVPLCHPHTGVPLPLKYYTCGSRHMAHTSQHQYGGKSSSLSGGGGVGGQHWKILSHYMNISHYRVYLPINAPAAVTEEGNYKDAPDATHSHSSHIAAYSPTKNMDDYLVSEPKVNPLLFKEIDFGCTSLLGVGAKTCPMCFSVLLRRANILDKSLDALDVQEAELRDALNKIKDRKKVTEKRLQSHLTDGQHLFKMASIQMDVHVPMPYRKTTASPAAHSTSVGGLNGQYNRSVKEALTSVSMTPKAASFPYGTSNKSPSASLAPLDQCDSPGAEYEILDVSFESAGISVAAGDGVSTGAAANVLSSPQLVTDVHGTATDQDVDLYSLDGLDAIPNSIINTRDGDSDGVFTTSSCASSGGGRELLGSANSTGSTTNGVADHNGNDCIPDVDSIGVGIVKAPANNDTVGSPNNKEDGTATQELESHLAYVLNDTNITTQDKEAILLVLQEEQKQVEYTELYYARAMEARIRSRDSSGKGTVKPTASTPSLPCRPPNTTNTVAGSSYHNYHTSPGSTVPSSTSRPSVAHSKSLSYTADSRVKEDCSLVRYPSTASYSTSGTHAHTSAPSSVFNANTGMERDRGRIASLSSYKDTARGDVDRGSGSGVGGYHRIGSEHGRPSIDYSKPVLVRPTSAGGVRSTVGRTTGGQGRYASPATNTRSPEMAKYTHTHAPSTSTTRPPNLFNSSATSSVGGRSTSSNQRTLGGSGLLRNPSDTSRYYGYK